MLFEHRLFIEKVYPTWKILESEKGETRLDKEYFIKSCFPTYKPSFGTGRKLSHQAYLLMKELNLYEKLYSIPLNGEKIVNTNYWVILDDYFQAPYYISKNNKKLVTPDENAIIWLTLNGGSLIQAAESHVLALNVH